MITFAKACRKEVAALPEEIRGDLADALARKRLKEVRS